MTSPIIPIRIRGGGSRTWRFRTNGAVWLPVGPGTRQMQPFSHVADPHLPGKELRQGRQRISVSLPSLAVSFAGELTPANSGLFCCYSLLYHSDYPEGLFV